MAAKPLKTNSRFPANVPTSTKLTYKIVVKKDFVKKDGTSPLYLQIFLNGKRKRINLDIYVPKQAFDQEKMRIKKSFVGSADLNLVIEQTLAMVNSIEVYYRLTNNLLTVDIVAKELKNPASRLDLLVFMEEQIEIDKKHLSEATIRSATSVLYKISTFKSPLLFKDLSVELINDMLAFMKKEHHNTQNTLFNVTKYLRKYVKRADRMGIVIPIKYNEIPHKKVKAEIEFLTKDEVNKLWEFYKNKYVPESYKIVLAKFIFSLFTGLRISDIIELNETNFLDDYLVKFVSKKSKKLQKIKLNSSAKQILKDGYLFKINYTTQYINRKLKEIAEMCEIPKEIHFHMARHSFATNFLKLGGRIEVLQQLLAHSSIRDTMGYIHVVQEDLNNEIFLLDNLFKEDSAMSNTNEETDD